MMGMMKEYAPTITAVVLFLGGLCAFGLWVINAQIHPQVARLDGRIDANEKLFTRISKDLEAIKAALATQNQSIVDFKTEMNDFKTEMRAELAKQGKLIAEVKTNVKWIEKLLDQGQLGVPPDDAKK